MALAHEQKVTIEEYWELRKNSEKLFEFIDGIVYMSPSPSTKHQRISSRLQGKLSAHLYGKTCEVFAAPYDIELTTAEVEESKIVIPDLSIICDPSGFTETKYIGVPNVMMEILSPSNQSHDLITKLNLYMKYGVKEYWIINPMLESVTIYLLNQEKMYEHYDIKTNVGVVHSQVIEGFSVEIKEIFS